MLTPAFHFTILDQFMDVFTEQASVLVGRLRNTGGEKVNVFPFVTKATLDIICGRKGHREPFVTFLLRDKALFFRLKPVSQSKHFSIAIVNLSHASKGSRFGNSSPLKSSNSISK